MDKNINITVVTGDTMFGKASVSKFADLLEKEILVILGFFFVTTFSSVRCCLNLAFKQMRPI